jgi:hypothetical protein
MYEFDSYINSIMSGLNISKMRKKELTDEFKDHLELLKSEYIEKGFSESESFSKAVERFGEWSDISKKLQKSIFGFRNSSNVLIGLLITITIIIFSIMPITGVTTAYLDYKSGTDIPKFFNVNYIYLLNGILFFIPIGYFLPIILNRICKVFQLALTYSILGILIGVCVSIPLTKGLNYEYILSSFIWGLLGGMLGYVILIVINKLTIGRKNFLVKMTLRDLKG